MALDTVDHSLSWMCPVGIVMALSALLRKKWSPSATLLLLPAVLLVSDLALFAYQTNSICGPHGHILKSETDAIEVAKEVVSQDNFYGWTVISGADVREAMNRTDNCCGATTTRKWDGVIVWDIWMVADREPTAFL